MVAVACTLTSASDDEDSPLYGGDGHCLVDTQIVHCCPTMCVCWGKGGGGRGREKGRERGRGRGTSIQKV